MDKEQLLAAFLADPEAAPDLNDNKRCGSLHEANVDRLLSLLHHNKVPLLAINSQQGPLQSALCANPAFQAAQAAERSYYESLRQEYSAAQALWRQEGIEDVLIKSAGIFPSFPYKTSNLDALVRQCDGNRARQILRANGYVELRNVEENHKFLFRKFHQGEEVLGLHVHEHVGWYASFLDETSLWERRRPAPDDETLTIPSPEDALLITIAHSFYEDKNIKLYDLAQIHYCLRQKLDWTYVFQVAENRDWLDGLYIALLIYAHLGRAWYGRTPMPPSILTHAESSLPHYVRRWLEHYLRQEPLRMPFRIPFIFSKYYFYKRLCCNRQKGPAGRAADLLIHTLQGTKLRLHLHSQPAMLISFSGIDGSGKTSQALTLQNAFTGCHIRTRYVWSRGGSSRFAGFFIKLAKRILGKLKDTALTPSDRQAERKAAFRHPLVQGIWGWLTAFELGVQYLLRVRLPMLFGYVIICDRYVYDMWVEWASYFGKGEEISQSRAARFLRWLAPQPDIAYWLRMPAQAAHERSSTAPPAEFMAEQGALYSKLAKVFRVSIKDAQRPFVELADEIAYETLTHYFDRYWTLVNAIFFRNPKPMPEEYFTRHSRKISSEG